MSLAIIARLEIDPVSIDSYVDAVHGVLAATRAEAGCQLYAFARDVEFPHVLWVSEEWESEEALSAHLHSPHITAFLRRTANMSILNQDVRKYQIAEIGTVVAPLVSAG